MSEYQYYEFLAIDRPLTAEEMKDLEIRGHHTNFQLILFGFLISYTWPSLFQIKFDF
jgi:hypothetical protein